MQTITTSFFSEGGSAQVVQINKDVLLFQSQVLKVPFLKTNAVTVFDALLRRCVHPLSAPIYMPSYAYESILFVSYLMMACSFAGEMLPSKLLAATAVDVRPTFTLAFFFHSTPDMLTFTAPRYQVVRASLLAAPESIQRSHSNRLPQRPLNSTLGPHPVGGLLLFRQIVQHSSPPLAQRHPHLLLLLYLGLFNDCSHWQYSCSCVGLDPAFCSQLNIYCQNQIRCYRTILSFPAVSWRLSWALWCRVRRADRKMCSEKRGFQITRDTFARVKGLLRGSLRGARSVAYYSCALG